MTIRALLTAAGLTALVAAPLAAQYPTTPPPAAPIKAAAFPPFQEATLPNGMKLLVVTSKKQPVVSLSLSFNAGRMYDPDGKSGLADMVAGLLTKGAGKRTADDISSAIEGVGGSITAGAGQDFLTIGADVLANDAALAFGLVADAAIRPTFPASEIDLLRTQTLSGLRLEMSQPASVASRVFAAGLYGNHPYGRRPSETSVKGITRDDLVAFHKARLRPSGALLVVAGSLTLEQAKALATTAFAGWVGVPTGRMGAGQPPERTATGITLVHKPGAVQSNILVGNLIWGPGDPRHYGAVVANRVLGGGADTRLFMILREQKSWTYGAYSTLNRYKGPGSFEANTEVRTEVTDSALVEMLAQLKRIGAEPIETAEFEQARNALTGSFPLRVETAADVAAQVTTARLLGLAPDYVQTYRQKLAAVTIADAQAAAAAGVRPSQALIVVVGDAAKLYDKLKGIAPITLQAMDGTELTPADLNVKAGALDLALDKLVPVRDSFAILVQGNALGFQTSSLEKVDGGWSYKETTKLATFINQSTEVRFTAGMQMQSVKQSGAQAGQNTSIDVLYANGHAKGKATTASQTGPKTIDVDADVPAGAVDDNILTALFPAFKWAAGKTFTVAVFQSGKGSATTMTLKVVGEESVKVLAGTFDAWKVEMSGGEAPATLWIEKGPNPRMLKLGVAGQPIEFQRIK
jgi:zinc protease